MNVFERMNAVINYIEDNIAGQIDYDNAAALACCPRNQFQRFFSYIAEIPLSEYIRRRRLTLSAFDLQKNALSITEVGSKYGYDSPSSFSRAFRGYHGVSPVKAKGKDVVFTIYPRLTFDIQNIDLERSKDKVAVLGKIEFITLPDCRMIGIKVLNGGGENPVPELWKKCFQANTFDALAGCKPVVDFYIGWMGEYNSETEKFTYIAGMLMPAGTPVPQGFDYRDVRACLVGNGYINGDFANGDVFTHSHELTVQGIVQNGYEPDYSYGWSAEVYAFDLAFDAEEGTVNYFCPCKKAAKKLRARGSYCKILRFLYNTYILYI